MCGIAGYVADHDLPGPDMVDVLTHRGPDQAGAYHARLGRRAVFLGHRRLSILDPSEAGRQPMATPDGAVTLVYNGEVYNYLDLQRRHLAHRALRSRTDTEVVLHLFEALGPGFVTHLNGDFALAVLDERRGRLFLYRDRLGVKPLYYYHTAGTFAFGSEVKALQAAGLPLTLSEESLQRYLVFKYVPGQETMHAEVRRLPPGCYAEYDLASGRLTLHRYWTPSPDPDAARLSYADARARLYDLLGDAVRLRLMADVPVGTFLSGGVDSSAIAHYVRDVPGLRHYCARKSDDDLRREGTTSDYAHARRLADAWGLDLVGVDIGRAEATRARIRQTLYYSDDLIADGSHIPSYLITRAAGETTRVLLSGMGGDELFLGYPSHQLALLARYLDVLPGGGGVARLLARLRQGRGALKAYRRWLHRFGRYYAYPPYKYGLFSIVGDFETALRVCRRDPAPVVARFEEAFPKGADPFASLTRFELDNFLVKNLHYTDRMCMAHGVEGRVPFLDHRLVAFALALPRSYKLTAAAHTKRILKDALRGALPAHVLRRRKAGFGMPLRSLFSDPAEVDRLLNLDFFGGFPVFDVDAIRGAVRAHGAGEQDQSALLYALVSFQEWYGVVHAQEVAA